MRGTVVFTALGLSACLMSHDYKCVGEGERDQKKGLCACPAGTKQSGDRCVEVEDADIDEVDACEDCEPFDAGVTDGAEPDVEVDAEQGDADQDGEVDAGSEAAPLIGVALGLLHSCALLPGGDVWCWGANDRGQIGTGAPAAMAGRAARITGISNVTAISAGGKNTCALRSDATVACWGDNSQGQLGNIAVDYSRTPIVVPGLTDVAKIAVGNRFACAVKKDRAVVCWGFNQSVQLGRPTEVGPTGYLPSRVPLEVPGVTEVDEIALGSAHVCVLHVDRTVTCWGKVNNLVFSNGDGSPSAITELSDITGLVAGSSHTCARRRDTSLACWGAGRDGQLGNDDTQESRVPVPVSGLTGVEDVASGPLYSCAVRVDGAVVCWGNNMHGALGRSDVAGSAAPLVVPDVSDAISVSSGSFHLCAMKGDMTVLCWGSNSQGQLGAEAAMDPSPPVPVTLR